MAKKSACEKVESVIDFKEHPEKIKVIEPNFQWTQNQIEFIKKALCKDTKIIILDGPAGSGKSEAATYSALRLIQDKKIDRIKYIRSAVESSVSSKIGQLGFLPKGVKEKFEEPYGQVFEEKLLHFLDYPNYHLLRDQDQYQILPPNYLRGSTFKDEVVIVDESSNFDWHLIELLLTRLGENAKIIFIGDSKQSDLPQFIKSGFIDLLKMFDTETARAKGIFSMHFGYEDVKRSKVLSFILEIINDYKSPKELKF